MAQLAAAGSTISSIGQRRWLDQLIEISGIVGRQTGNAPEPYLRPCVHWQAGTAPFDTARRSTPPRKRNATASRRGKPWRLLRMARYAHKTGAPLVSLNMADLLTGKRVSRAHIWRMDQILPPELNDLEFEAMRQLAAHPATHHIPPHIQSRLKDIGYAKEVLGGIVLTKDGLQRISEGRLVAPVHTWRTR